MKYFSYNLALFLFLLSFVFSGGVFAATDADSVNVELNVLGCNNNLVCEPGAGEDETTCPLDCSDDIPEEEDPATIPTTGGIAPTAELLIENVVVRPTTDTAVISFDTTIDAVVVLSWGITNGYELGSTATPRPQDRFLFALSSLKANQKYQFSITAIAGGQKYVYKNTFVTKAIPEASVLPDPVTDVDSSQEEERVLVTWKNPEEFDYIRVMRRADRYPLSPFDGEVAYEGTVESFSEIIDVDSCAYYTIFARRGSQYSSGVSTSTCDGAGFGDNTVPGGTALLSPGDISFLQQGKRIPSELDRSYYDPNQDVFVQVSRQPNIFQQGFILVLNDGVSGTTMTYVLQYNEASGMYETVLDINKQTSSSDYTLFVLSRGEVIGVVSGLLIAEGGLYVSSQSFFDIQPGILLAVLIIILILLGALMARMNRREA